MFYYLKRNPFETLMCRENNRKKINTTILMNKIVYSPAMFADKIPFL